MNNLYFYAFLEMESYKIPREVQIEDRIFGPITMRRLIILSVGGGFTYLVWLKLGKTYGPAVWGIPVFLFGSLTLAWAFLEPLGIRFGKFLLRLVEFMIHPKILTFDKRFSQQVFFQFIESQSRNQNFSEKKNGPNESEIYNEKQKTLERLHEITPLLDMDNRLSHS